MMERKKKNVKFYAIRKTDENIISIRYGCLRFSHSYRFLQGGLGILGNTLDHIDFGIS